MLKAWQALVPVTMLAAVAFAQEPASFEVASIRRAAGTPFRGSPVGPGTADPEHYATRNTQVKSLIMTAYGLENYQIVGPASIDARWDILANIASGVTKQQVNRMLQSLLEDRFHLTFHHETKEFKAYDLVIAKGGLKLKESIPTDACSMGGRPPGGAPCPPMSQRFGIAKSASSAPGMLSWPGSKSPDHTLAGVNARMAGLTRALRSVRGGALVIDRTGLSGSYDVRIEFARPDLPAQDDTPLPSVFTALEQQLGLRLEPVKTMVEMTVIDHIDSTPTEN